MRNGRQSFQRQQGEEKESEKKITTTTTTTNTKREGTDRKNILTIPRKKNIHIVISFSIREWECAVSEITSGVSIELLLCLNLLDSSANSIQKRVRDESI